MQEKNKQLKGKDIVLTIDNKECKGKFGQTILDIARENDIYIPTMCHVAKLTPTGSCRMCAVEVDGVDGVVLSCEQKATDGLVVTTNSPALFEQRQNIVKMYDVNHPLQCGVCDKSGECELQNKTLEFEVDSQNFSAKEIDRKNIKWGVLGYDPYLCIMCERCVRTCNEVVGASAISVVNSGYKSAIDVKMSYCEQCAECVSVCPVGALISNEYKYSMNSWEARKVPSACSFCSIACHINYEVGKDIKGNESIARITTDAEFVSLCRAGKFGYDIANNGQKDSKKLKEVVEKIKNADAIRFASYITNEEALILQKIKDKYGIKLYNEQARDFKLFLDGFASAKGKKLYDGNLQTIKDSDFVLSIGSKMFSDNVVLKFAINEAIKKRGADFVYMHPIAEPNLQRHITEFIKYEVGAEEGVLALLAKAFIKEPSSEVSKFLNDLDVGNLSAESSVGEEEIELIASLKSKRNKPVLVVGDDLFGHERKYQLGKLVAIIEKYTDFKVVLVPQAVNTFGVSLICALDKDESGKNVIGYNHYGDYVISSDGNGDFNTPALNQQEGTFVNVDKRVVPINVALEFEGYCLNDIANELGIEAQYTIDYTKELPKEAGFKEVEFDSLENHYNNAGEDCRGYELENLYAKEDESLEEVAPIGSFDGAVIYQYEPQGQYNWVTNNCKVLKDKDPLIGSKTFKASAKIVSSEFYVCYGDIKEKKKFKADKNLSGNIALFPTFNSGLGGSKLFNGGYRFKKVTIQNIEEEK